MKIAQKALVSRMISSPITDVEVHTREGSKGIWDILAISCDKNMASAVNFVDSALRSVNIMQLPGYGNSTFKTDVASMGLGDHMAAMDMARPSDNTVLFGYSHGGYFTTQYALQRPGNVRALILVEPALFSAKEDLMERAAMIDAGKEVESMARMITTVDSAAGRTDAQLRQVAEQLNSNVNSGSSVAQEYRIRAANEVTEEDLAKLDMPVLLIAGTKSHASFMVKRAFQAIPHASVCWIEGASHLDLEKVEYAQQIARAIDGFMEQITCKGNTGFKNLMADLDTALVASPAVTAPVAAVLS